VAFAQTSRTEEVGCAHGFDTIPIKWRRIPRDGDCVDETCCGSPLSGNSR
jgi:hypothetical protein